MSRNSTYQIRLSKIVMGGPRNIDTYYLVLKADRQPVKYISKAMRNDEDNQDCVSGEVEIKPTLLELWNYDKMKLVDRYPVDFKAQPVFKNTLYQHNLEVTVERHNLWEEEIKNRNKQGAAEGETVKESQALPPRSLAVSNKSIQPSTGRLKNSAAKPRNDPNTITSPLLTPKKVHDSTLSSALNAKLLPRPEAEV